MKKSNKSTPDRVSKTQLSRLLAYSRNTVSRHLAKPDAPKPDRNGLFDQAAALAFLRGVITKAGRPATELEKLRVRRLTAEVERAELELAKARGEFVRLASVWPQVQRTILELNADLYRRFEHELPPRLVGKRLIEISLTCRDALDASFAAFRAGGQRIQPGATPPAAQ